MTPPARARMRALALVVLVLGALAGAGAGTYAAFSATASNGSSTASAAGSFGATGPCGYRERVLATPDLQAYWRLGESAGATAIDAAGSRHATYANGVTQGAAGALLTDGDGAAAFDGVDDRVTLPSSVSLPLNSAVTVEFWAYVASPAQDSSAFTIGDRDTPDRVLALVPWSDNRLYWYYGANAVNADYAPYLNRWTHVVLTSTGNAGTQQAVYLDGQLRASASTSDGPNQAVSGGAIGQWPYGYLFHKGRLDEFALYTRALSAAEVQAHFTANCTYRGVVSATRGLAAYWPLDESAGTVAQDVKGSRTGTYSGGVTLGAIGALGREPATRAADFNGTDGRLGFGDALDFAGNRAQSVELWMNRTSVGEATTWRQPLGKSGGSPRQGWDLTVAPATQAAPQRLRLERWVDGARSSVDATTPIAAGTWYHVVGTYDGASLRLYVNGQLEATSASAASLRDTALGLAAGGGAGGDAYGGRLDEMALYGVALTPAQVLAHYQAGR